MTDKHAALMLLAQRTVQQWDNHGRFRDFYNEGEPPEVRLARGYLELAELQFLRGRQADVVLNEGQ